MKEIQINFNLDELEELWYACYFSKLEAKNENRPLTARDLDKLQQKLMNNIMNLKSQQEL